MVRNSQVHKRKRDNMDGETAIAFAANRFEQLHPRETCPEWLPRCTSIGYHWDKDDNYIVGFAVTPIATNDAVCYFEVSVDPLTANTVVIRDESTLMFVGEELQGYSQSRNTA